ncbi:MAG: HAD superfamily phosphoserine phosphatase-like hydrolase [Bermanella sp.]|jgi:phosphatidylglycerophosphatase C
MNKLAIFDFDETLVKENSLSLLFKYFLGNKPLFLYLWPILTNYRIYIGSIRQIIKNRLYKISLNKKSKEQVFQAGGDAAKKLTLIQPVIDRMMLLHSQGVEVWIITASPQLFIEGIVTELKWPVKRVIGTLLVEENNLLNGLIGNECQMEEKVIRFNELTEKEKIQYSVEEAYGNLPVDIPMLELAEKKFYVKNGVLCRFVKH